MLGWRGGSNSSSSQTTIVEKDAFTFSIAIKQRSITRRGTLSIVSSIYDPLGFLSPIILSAKQILQNLCRIKLPWYEKIPLNIALRWQRWLDELIPLNTFKGEQMLNMQRFDASEVGYGAVSYLRRLNDKGEVNVAFTIGKVKVVPLKQTTIPRLELSAAVLAVRLDRMLSRSFIWMNLSSGQTALQY